MNKVLDLEQRVKELEEEVEMYEAMKEGVAMRIADLEKRNEELERILKKIIEG